MATIIHHELGHRFFGLWHTHQDPVLEDRLRLKMKNPDHNWTPAEEEKIVRFGRMPIRGPLIGRMSYGAGFPQFDTYKEDTYFKPASAEQNPFTLLQEKWWIFNGVCESIFCGMSMVPDEEVLAKLKRTVCRKYLKSGSSKTKNKQILLDYVPLVLDFAATVCDLVTGEPKHLAADERRLYRQIRHYQINHKNRKETEQ